MHVVVIVVLSHMCLVSEEDQLALAHAIDASLVDAFSVDMAYRYPRTFATEDKMKQNILAEFKKCSTVLDNLLGDASNKSKMSLQQRRDNQAKSTSSKEPSYSKNPSLAELSASFLAGRISSVPTASASLLHIVAQLPPAPEESRLRDDYKTISVNSSASSQHNNSNTSQQYNPQLVAEAKDSAEHMHESRRAKEIIAQHGIHESQLVCVHVYICVLHVIACVCICSLCIQDVCVCFCMYVGCFGNVRLCIVLRFLNWSIK
jgi:hypothetical protein